MLPGQLLSLDLDLALDRLRLSTGQLALGMGDLNLRLALGGLLDPAERRNRCLVPDQAHVGPPPAPPGPGAGAGEGLCLQHINNLGISERGSPYVLVALALVIDRVQPGDELAGPGSPRAAVQLVPPQDHRPVPGRRPPGLTPGVASGPAYRAGRGPGGPAAGLALRPGLAGRVSRIAARPAERTVGDGRQPGGAADVAAGIGRRAAHWGRRRTRASIGGTGSRPGPFGRVKGGPLRLTCRGHGHPAGLREERCERCQGHRDATPGEKRLVFCDSKQLVEQLDAQLREFASPHTWSTRCSRLTNGGVRSRRSPRAGTA